ncbi:MAG TPA: glutamyl-tRNA reductase, partial [Tepidisphaeraceae bacterium]|nr:glutamyl-tRNA reductase [Tepidisphaeraceae bacterium]
VVGETQIIGQVREAYEEACNLGSAGPMLNPLFQRAIAAGKAATTAIAHRGDAPSIASAAMHLVRQTAGPLGAKSVLSIGAGDVSRQVLNYLRAIGPARLLISNRTDETARALAREYSGETVDFSRLAEGIALADVVVTSTSSRRPIVGLRHFERSTVTVQPPKLLMDLGVPRDIEPVVRSLPGILLHDLDDLGNTVSGSTRQSTGSSSAAEAILREHLHDYAAWQRARDFGPTIASLYDRYHVLAEEELQRAIAGMSMQSPADVARLRGFAERMVNKLLHDPVQSLREADSLQSPAHNYAEVLRKLFKLPTPPEEEI